MKIKNNIYNQNLYNNKKPKLDNNKHNCNTIEKKNFSTVLRQKNATIEKLEIDLYENYSHHKQWWSHNLKILATVEHINPVYDSSTATINAIKLTDILKTLSNNSNHLKIKLL